MLVAGRSTRPTAVPEPAYGPRAVGDAAGIDAALRPASPVPFWLDSPARPTPEPALAGAATADLVVVGGGYCGLWTALLAKEREPERDVVLLEAREIAWAASGRNGGFCESTLTHGAENGDRHFPDERRQLDRLGLENFAEFRETLVRHSIDAEFETPGGLTVATEPHQVPGLRALAETAPAGHYTFLDADRVRSVVDSPLYRAGLLETEGVALVHPAKLAWGLRRACLELGVRIHERSPVVGLDRDGDGVAVRTRAGRVRARSVALATNGFPSLIRRTRLLTVPVYDYALMTEPLTADQLTSIGWTGRQGVTDSSRQFHYYRLSADNRILWGGYDAVYHRGGRIRPAQDRREQTFRLLADHFFRTFPPLADVRFSHAWGGMIDMSSRLMAFHGTAWHGRVAYSAGYTGLGVAATRFGAKVMLDLLAGKPTELTELRAVGSLPIPIPPEPVRYPAITLTRRAVARSDARGGKDGLLLRSLDALGVGFDS
ncbi:NAD(P)/FAD-dependent oxidoreductase [Planctomonas deserti]|uniref:NAD(P)/FAD-dependent oxidoreductase n=1 Tax=Planctomonas deserti TaxID=2144185 RepID=UPI000D3CC000|nr:FAD-dependent oxidoreductase [Planctomonas deserti]